MAENSLLKEILDTLSDPDTVKFFAAVHGLVGNSEVEHRLKELEWNEHIENLWQEVLPAIQPSLKRLQDSLDDDDDKPSTSGYDVLSTSNHLERNNERRFFHHHNPPQQMITDSMVEAGWVLSQRMNLRNPTISGKGMFEPLKKTWPVKPLSKLNLMNSGGVINW